jgi:hypothetical protein
MQQDVKSANISQLADINRSPSTIPRRLTGCACNDIDQYVQIAAVSGCTPLSGCDFRLFIRASSYRRDNKAKEAVSS